MDPNGDCQVGESIRKSMFHGKLMKRNMHSITELTLNFITDNGSSDFIKDVEKSELFKLNESEFDNNDLIDSEIDLIEESIKKNQIQISEEEMDEKLMQTVDYLRIDLDNFNLRKSELFCTETLENIPEIKQNETLNRLIGSVEKNYTFYNIIGKNKLTSIYILIKHKQSNNLKIIRIDTNALTNEWLKYSYMHKIHPSYTEETYYIVPIDLRESLYNRFDDNAFLYIYSKLPSTSVNYLSLLITPDIDKDLASLTNCSLGACTFVGVKLAMCFILGISNNYKRFEYYLQNDKHGMKTINFLKLLILQQIGFFSVHEEQNLAYNIFNMNNIKINYDEYKNNIKLSLWKDLPMKKRGRPRKNDNTVYMNKQYDLPNSVKAKSTIIKRNTKSNKAKRKSIANNKKKHTKIKSNKQNKNENKRNRKRNYNTMNDNNIKNSKYNSSNKKSRKREIDSDDSEFQSNENYNNSDKRRKTNDFQFEYK